MMVQDKTDEEAERYGIRRRRPAGAERASRPAHRDLSQGRRRLQIRLGCLPLRRSASVIGTASRQGVDAYDAILATLRGNAVLAPG